MNKPLLALTLLTSLLAAPARAESSASSSISDSASSATSKVSDSFEDSSKSSSGGDRKVAAGDYRVIEMAAAADKPGQQRVLLRTDDGNELHLLLPQAAAERGQLAAGRRVLVSERPYGWEFAAADTRQAFFLVLEDAWHRELQPRAVAL
ncbi:MAG: hypothetical protein JO006_10650 [Paucibacter sp.]|nr:hypothetical protein [Roseateles sp.]